MVQQHGTQMGYTPQQPFPLQQPFPGAPGAAQTPQPPPDFDNMPWKPPGTGLRTPLIELTGRLLGWTKEMDNWDKLNINFTFDQVRVMRSVVPYPYDTAAIGIKFSTTQNSGWGVFQGSAEAKGFQGRTNKETLDAMVGFQLHLLKTEQESFGTNRDGQEMHGPAWRVIAVLAAPPGKAMPTAQGTPSAAQPVQPGVAQAPSGLAAPVTGPIRDPNQRAKIWLAGRNLPKFLQAALVDPIIKTDGALFNSILNQTFISGLKSSGQVTEAADGAFIVKDAAGAVMPYVEKLD